MGHYDSSYAADDYHSMSQKEKKPYFAKFDKEFKANKGIWHTHDDVSGWIFNEWLKIRGYRENKDGTVIDVNEDKLLSLAKKIIKENKNESNKG